MFKYAFIGTGNMAEAIITGLITSGTATPAEILCCDTNKERLQSVSARFQGIETAVSASKIAPSQVVILCVKPGQIIDVARQLPEECRENSLIVSIAAGVSLSTLTHALPLARIVRVMPNTPALVQAGVSCFSTNTLATAADRTAVTQLLHAVGLVFEVEESQLDAVTALSGSGPGYLCLVVEALSDAGVKLGLPRQLAQTLAAQTVYGTGKMILETGEHPALLREKVTSPGGTTIAGLAALEAAGVRSAFIAAAETACARSKELGRS
ncbi:pyrroline-5-carboxylate reductase [Chrysiogenes arsenatis]|uniref:pyrroline-5-carboxylate reductase n=1 Tax=Chrysiogenes arsenatis TaxID=309797 RepID=UPI00041F7565|nr:pyrroline-5-carboxylate reductase [Chrysiogenes arsenatis]